MIDWAEDAFDEIYRSILNDHLEVSKPLTLAILRKAKADGMREAASIVQTKRLEQAGKRDHADETSVDWQVYNQGVFITGKLWDEIHAEARDKLQTPTE